MRFGWLTHIFTAVENLKMSKDLCDYGNSMGILWFSLEFLKFYIQFLQNLIAYPFVFHVIPTFFCIFFLVDIPYYFFFFLLRHRVWTMFKNCLGNTEKSNENFNNSYSCQPWHFISINTREYIFFFRRSQLSFILRVSILNFQCFSHSILVYYS